MGIGPLVAFLLPKSSCRCMLISVVTIKEIYALSIEMATVHDPRGKAGVEKYLARVRREYEELPTKKKAEFDLESLKNPYADSRLLFGDPSTIVDKVLVGIDITGAEVLLADRLNEKGEGIDLIIGHHPHGEALVSLFEVMDVQVDLQLLAGVPVNVAEGLTNKRMAEVRRKFWPLNHFQAVDTARLLNLPFMVLHTVTDNLVYDFLKNLVEEKKPETVGEVLEMLKEVPEYKEATRQKAGPVLFTGAEKNRAGRVAPLEITGGTEGAKELYERLAYAGVGTVIGMHASEEHREEAEKHHINLVIAGHISSDSLGMNLFLDELEKWGVGVIPCSGLIRVRRT